MQYDQTTAECRVFSYKEGLLSRVGHDLELEVQRFTVDFEGDSVTATFDPSSLRVLHAVKDGRPNPGALSVSDKDTIHKYIRNDILHPGRYRSIDFESTDVEEDDEGLRVEGELTLHGRTRELEAEVVAKDGKLVAEVKIHQPDFGIKPFKALMGTLRIQPTVLVRLSIPLPE